MVLNSRMIDKKILREYEQACAIIHEAESGKKVMKWQLARALTIREAVEEKLKDAPLRIQRTIRPGRTLLVGIPVSLLGLHL